jgi:hypothetical protein
MVHWVGEGSNVIICLARDSTPVVRFQGGRFSSPTHPSAVYISYDYGDTFENKTELFRIMPYVSNLEYAVVDKFTNHPKYYQHVSVGHEISVYYVHISLSLFMYIR